MINNPEYKGEWKAKKLETLNVATNDLGENSVSYVLQAVRSCGIKHLVMDGNPMADRGTKLLMRGLAKQCIGEKAKNSDLSSISSSSDDSKKGDDVTEASSQLESLSLDATEIDVKGLKNIIAFLSLNPPLKSP